MTKYFYIKYGELHSNKEFKNLDFNSMTDFELINLCLEKWRYISENEPLLVFNGGDTCALCRKYLENSCFGCPIYKKTGYYCLNTPNSELEDLQDEYCEDIDEVSDEYYELVKAEIELLENIKNEIGNNL